MNKLSTNQPEISIIVLMNEYTEFTKLFNYNYNNIDYPQDKLEWIIIDDSSKNNMDLFPLEENILYFHLDDCKEYIDKIEFKEDKDENSKKYLLKTNTLPNGFKRDYGVGLSSHEYIFHLDIDCYYNPQDVMLKKKFLIFNQAYLKN